MAPPSQRLKRGRIVVTSVAANTALGGLPEAAAAARAGISRPAPLEEVVFDAQGEPSPITGHPVGTVLGFCGDARHFSLALPALLKLGPPEPDPREEVGFYLALPAAPSEAANPDSPRPPHLIERLLEAAGLVSPPALRQAFRMGNAGFVHAVEAALRALAEGRVRSCIVGGVDSQLDGRAMAALLAQRRIASADNAAGLHPGEAAVFLRLERREAPEYRAGLAEIAAVQTGWDRPFGDESPRGDGIFTTVAACLAEAPDASAQRCWFVTDNNGEDWRAQDWSCCQVKFNQTHRELASAPVWHPAASFGDTGAASAPVAAMMAIQAFVRRFAPGELAFVVCASDGGERGAIAFARPS